MIICLLSHFSGNTSHHPVLHTIIVIEMNIDSHIDLACMKDQWSQLFKRMSYTLCIFVNRPQLQEIIMSNFIRILVVGLSFLFMDIFQELNSSGHATCICVCVHNSSIWRAVNRISGKQSKWLACNFFLNWTQVNIHDVQSKNNDAHRK